MSIPCTCRVSHLCEFADVELDHIFENKHMSIYYTCKVSHLCEFADVELVLIFENKHMSTVHTWIFFISMYYLMFQKTKFEGTGKGTNITCKNFTSMWGILWVIHFFLFSDISEELSISLQLTFSAVTSSWCSLICPIKNLS